MNLLPENIVNLKAISTDRVLLPLISNAGIILDVLRLDKIDPIISGNKWFKLQFYLAEALVQGKKRLLTFGGAYSNHIIATACTAQRAGLASTGIIRGEKPVRLSHTLQHAADYGMQLVFISREQYHQKNSPASMLQLRHEYGDACIIPEGGDGPLGIKGAATILDTAGSIAYTHILCAVGTGTLLLGLLEKPAADRRIVGFPVLKGFEAWQPGQTTLAAQQRISIINDYHFGGYAKKSGLLIDFMNDWYLQTGIPSDFVYTGKLFFGTIDLIKKGFFQQESRLLVIHSGGLQGNHSLPAKTLFF